MRISVIGCGYLGAVHAASMAKLGHEVIGIDVDESKINALAAGKAPFFEPGLPELLTETYASGRLKFSTDIADAKGAKVHFICVGTPQQQGSYAADLTYVNASFTDIARYLEPGDVVVGKSTVPVGTAARIEKIIKSVQPKASLVWNPEFLREGYAVQDTLHPDRVVYGLPSGEEAKQAATILDEVYAAPLADNTPKIETDYPTAELVKVAANSFLATKISFINAMAELCETTGGDVTQLADAIGHDNRIGRRFLNAGLGFGGGCLPKDIRAFLARAEELGADQAVSFLKEIDAINLRRRSRMIDLTRDVLKEQDLAGAKVTILGVTFKPNSDDIRDSPALDVANKLQDAGAYVTVTDPQGVSNAKRANPHLKYEENLEVAVADADVILLLTEWDEYRQLTPEKLDNLVKHKRILDGRNVLNPEQWRNAGWAYRALGRP